MITEIGLFQIIFYLSILLLLVKPLGWYMARVYEGKPRGLAKLLAPLERFIYALSGIRPEMEMSWKTYAVAMVLFETGSVFVVYAL